MSAEIGHEGALDYLRSLPGGESEFPGPAIPYTFEMHTRLMAQLKERTQAPSESEG